MDKEEMYAVAYGEVEVKPSEIFENAVALMDERGWCQNTSSTPTGRICAANALTIAGKTLVVYQFISKRTKGPLSVWNDKPGRTYDEVRDLFMTCAKELRDEGR